jgi:hypothetical protein
MKVMNRSCDAAEKVRERGHAIVGVEPVHLIDSNPRQLLAPPRDFIAEPGQLLFLCEQREPGVQPFIARNDLVVHLAVSCLARAASRGAASMASW